MKETEYIQIDEWISQYQNGTIDKESLRKLTHWASASEANKVYVRQRIEIWFSTGIIGSARTFNTDKAFERFKKRTAQAPHSSSETKVIPLLLWKTLLRVAAIILIVLLPLAGYWQSKKSFREHFADISIESPMGSRTKLYLPDGTLVWLNSGSKIIYSQGFGLDNRELNLEGEGYFEVTPNKKLPFKIHTKEVGLQVLGTKFNFRNYSDDAEIVVNLMEGKVALHNEIRPMSELYLCPQEKMTMNKRTGEMIKSKANVTHSNTWIENELIFDEDLLDDIAKRLMRSYNVTITVADSLKGRRFYGNFKVHENTVEQILSTIASTNQMHYKYVNGNYLLY